MTVDNTGMDPLLYQPLAPSDATPVAAPDVPAAAPAAPVADDSAPLDPSILAALNKPVGSSDKPPAHHGAPQSHAAHSVSHGPTQYKQAGTPAPVADPEMTWGQVGQGVLHNALPSAAQGISGIVGAVTHPVETLGNLGNLAKGAGSQIMGALGEQQDPKTKAANEAMINALESHYATGYGSVKGFKKNLATDPFGVAMDASTIIDPAAGAIGKMGEAGKLGALSGVAKTAAGAAKYANPVQSALAIARAPGAALSAVGRGVGSVTSRVPMSALDLATAAGKSGGAAQEAFSRFANGSGDTAEFATAAQNAMQKIRDKASADYLAGKSNLAPVTPSFKPIDDAVAEARQRTMLGGRSFQQQAGQFQNANDAIDKAEAMIGAWKSNPAVGNLDGVDNLKQAIYDQAASHPAGSAANGALMKIYHGVKQALVDADPAYADLMESYQEGLRNTNDLTKTLGLGKNAAASATLAKNLKALKTGTGTNLLQQLLDQDPRIGGMLAGSAVNPWSQHASLWEAALGAGLPTMLAHPIGAMGAIPGAAAGFAMSSPRIVGSAANMAGKAGRAAEVVSSPLVQGAAKGSYYASRPDALQSAPVAAPSAPATSGPKPNANNIGNVRGRKGFVQPATPVDGAALAASTLLKGYRGLTLGEIAHKWAPASDHNDPDGWAANVSRATGINVNDVPNMDDPDALANLIKGIGVAEKKPEDLAMFDPATIRQGVTSAMATGRAAGGQTGPSHNDLVDRLMNAAKHAKRASTEATKPLLNVPDSAVAKALDLAQKAI